MEGGPNEMHLYPRGCYFRLFVPTPMDTFCFALSCPFVNKGMEALSKPFEKFCCNHFAKAHLGFLHKGIDPWLDAEA